MCSNFNNQVTIFPFFHEEWIKYVLFKGKASTLRAKNIPSLENKL
jgi:hypothetical protein